MISRTVAINTAFVHMPNFHRFKWAGNKTCLNWYHPLSDYTWHPSSMIQGCQRIIYTWVFYLIAIIGHEFVWSCFEPCYLSVRCPVATSKPHTGEKEKNVLNWALKWILSFLESASFCCTTGSLKGRKCKWRTVHFYKNKLTFIWPCEVPGSPTFLWSFCLS